MNVNTDPRYAPSNIPKNDMVMRMLMAALVVMVLRASSCAEPAPSVCFEKTCVQVELADTPDSRVRGLMFRDSLAQGHGMLFVFEEEGRYGFWMKNMKIPLDLIWLDAGLRVVDIMTHVPACSIEPCPSYIPVRPARYVLEVSAGFVDSHRIRIGDNARF